MSRIDKLAFIHFAKAAGRYIGHYLCTQIFGNSASDLAEQEYKVFNSWERPYLLDRDWTETELLQLANNRFPEQSATPAQIKAHHRLWKHNYLDKQYVHNHHYSWCERTVREFRRNGWFTFMFIRDPAELLCSLWTWARKARAAGTDPRYIIQPTRLIEMELDAFIKEIISCPELRQFYALPDYVDEIDHVAEFTEDNFRLFVKTVEPGHQYGSEQIVFSHRHASGNPGYGGYRRRGLISDETHELLRDTPEVQRVRELIANPA